jgi:hypothetical protein
MGNLARGILAQNLQSLQAFALTKSKIELSLIL